MPNKLNEGVWKEAFDLALGESTAVQMSDEGLYRKFVMLEILLKCAERDGHVCVRVNSLMILF